MGIDWMTGRDSPRPSHPPTPNGSASQLLAALEPSGMTPRPPQRLGAVALDLALGDGPRLADERGAQPSRVDLMAQRGRGKAETVARLGQCQDLHA